MLLPRPALFTLLAVFGRVTAFDREVCLNAAQWMIGNGTLSLDSPFLYRDTPDGPPYVDTNNFTLTLAGCNAICGTGHTWYPDTGPRINSWILPAILLLINVETSPLGKRNLLELLHLIGDPIDSLWSLLHKVDAWDHCCAYIARFKVLCPSCQLIIATVLAGHEEIQGPRITLERNNFDVLIERFQLFDHFVEWRRTAVLLASSRTDQLLRTVLALILYLYQLVSNWVPQIGGVPSSTPSKSRIATAVLLTCFVPTILLTNAVGTFASSRSAYDAMANLAIRTEGHASHVMPRVSYFLRKSSLMGRTSISNSVVSLSWSGGTYIYRPWKLQYIMANRNSSLRTILYILLAATPVLIGFIGGSLLLWWQTPRGFNCRHIWMITVSLLWMTSAFITMLSHNVSFATGKYHWRFVLLKDAFVALPSFLMFFLSTSGLFNSCWCWSGPWEYRGYGRVILSNTLFESDGTIMYPMTLSAALFLQLLLVTYIICSFRRGFRLLRWRKDDLQRQSDLVLTGAMRCGCISKMQAEWALISDTRRASSYLLRIEEGEGNTDKSPGNGPVRQ